ncbi:MAG: hypothetical protein QOF78_1928 [Phycisphaerales bacterium]|jgi:hypothetical protein|nr:hypothetical protein [Phycisphaerales bacterium]
MTINLKEEVRRALQTEWPAFAASHPKLAAVLDETVLVDPAIQSLADDPDYLEAMQTASAVGAGSEIIADIILRHVRQWLRRLV